MATGTRKTETDPAIDAAAALTPTPTGSVTLTSDLPASEPTPEPVERFVLGISSKISLDGSAEYVGRYNDAKIYMSVALAQGVDGGTFTMPEWADRNGVSKGHASGFLTVGRWLTKVDPALTDDEAGLAVGRTALFVQNGTKGIKNVNALLTRLNSGVATTMADVTGEMMADVLATLAATVKADRKAAALAAASGVTPIKGAHVDTRDGEPEGHRTAETNASRCTQILTILTRMTYGEDDRVSPEMLADVEGIDAHWATFHAWLEDSRVSRTA